MTKQHTPNNPPKPVDLYKKDGFVPPAHTFATSSTIYNTALQVKIPNDAYRVLSNDSTQPLKSFTGLGAWLDKNSYDSSYVVARQWVLANLDKFMAGYKYGFAPIKYWYLLDYWGDLISEVKFFQTSSGLFDSDITTVDKTEVGCGIRFLKESDAEVFAKLINDDDVEVISADDLAMIIERDGLYE